MKFGIRGQLTDVITCVKFLVDRFRGYGVLTPPKLPFPIDLLRRPYNSVALPCDTVITTTVKAVNEHVHTGPIFCDRHAACNHGCMQGVDVGQSSVGDDLSSVDVLHAACMSIVQYA